MNDQQHVLVTGGAGYIGSHTIVELLDSGCSVTVLDNFCNSSPIALERVREVMGKSFRQICVDLRDAPALAAAFATTSVDAVIHFAGLKAVGESVAEPLPYYDNNLIGTLNLLRVMDDADVRTLVFSSSATVYGDPASVPIKEDFPLAATNPYGRTKLMIEDILRDLHKSDPRWSMAILRYFNPVGAHPSGRMGEDPRGIPNNLLPFICRVATGQLPSLGVFGDDYPTPDGTGVRDFIHVMDLAAGHLKALEALHEGNLLTLNLGTGRGTSVLEAIRTFEEVSGRKIPHEIRPRRPGDIAACWADPSLAQQQLNWRAEKDFRAMCKDAWNWQKNNPSGYAAQS